MKPKPWELNPFLSKESIEEVAELLQVVRGEVIELHDDKLGDTPQSLGVRCYECCRMRIIGAAKDGVINGLSVIKKTKKFTFALNGVPVRFVRSDIDRDLPSDKLVPCEEAVAQMDLFPETFDERNVVWYVLIEAFHKHVADKMYFVGYSQSGHIVAMWDIPLDGREGILGDVPITPPAPETTEKAPMKLRQRKEAVKNKDE